ncbi:uncharacterized protein [Oscarella lobularis]|uniref:uncharacterized protein isoform X2 n=1 Tax=Oscarella lobularis TaxID=121494 RepID=UPI003313A89A
MRLRCRLISYSNPALAVERSWMSRVSLLLCIFVALIVAAIFSRGQASGPPPSPFDATRFAKSGCIIAQRFVLHSYEEPSVSRGNALLRFSNFYYGVVVFREPERMCFAMCEEGDHAIWFASRQSDTASRLTLISGICVFFVFPLFLLMFVATCNYRKRYRFAKSDSACSSPKVNKVRRCVASTKSRHCFVVIAFLLASIVPKSVSAQSCKGCGGLFPFCTSSSCFHHSYLMRENPGDVTWPEAVDFCLSKGAALASFQDEKEENALEAFLLDLSNFRGKTQFFFGLIRRPTSATGIYSYQLSDGSPLLTYDRWNRLGTFNDENTCGMVQIPSDLSTMHWKAESCLSRHQFFCKKPRKTTRSNGDVRLVGGVSRERGLLEVFQSGFWRRVCLSENIYSAGRTAAVSCRQLGYSGVLEASSRVGKIDNVSIHINCTSNNEFVRSCGRSDATCNEHVYVFCRFDSVKPFDVRLGKSSVPFRGVLEFRFESEWKPVCPSGSLNKMYDAVCKHLGYGEGKGTALPYITHSTCLTAKCGGYCESIQDFDFLSLKPSFFKYHEITCQNSDWSIRLVNGFGGTKQSEGRVEVHLNQRWRVVCDSKWNLNDSVVVCRQLDYGEPILAKRRFPATKNDVMIYTNGRRCEGNETALRDCISFIEDPNEACEEVVIRCKERKGCPFGWFIYADYCYSLSSSAVVLTRYFWSIGFNGFPSELHCGRSLLSISSSHEHAFVMALLAELESKGNLHSNDVWIGLDRNRDNQFKWNNRELLSRAMWSRGEPSADPLRTCVAMDTRTGYWKTADCFSNKQKLCKVALVDFDNEVRETDTPSFNGRCAKDEIYFKDACYYLSKDEDKAVSQKRAHRKICQNRNASLASLSSIGEYFFIAKESSTSNGSAYWIGLVYNYTTRSFTWLNGIPATFTKWAKYEPAHEKGRCVTFGFDGVDFGWSVAKCSTKAGYVCKKELKDSYGVESHTEIPFGYVYMCPSGWTKLGTRWCITRIDIAKTWHESLAECERLSSGNGSLASIHSRHEMDLLLLDRVESWIGLNDIDNEGIYNWADDSPLVYANWKSSGRDTSSLQREKLDCVAATNSSWQLRHCSEKKKSFCRSPASIDFNECLSEANDCHVNATCENTQYSFKCKCNQGFTGNGITCEDVDECIQSSPCLNDVQDCVNGLGSFECVCANGYTGDGSHCDDIDECLGNICHSQANCKNTNGSVECTCNYGYTGNGSHCDDIDECIGNICHSQANCKNTNGSVECTCNYGYTGDGSFCQAIVDTQNLSISETSIIVSVMCSLLALVLLSAVYVYHKKHHSAKKETLDDNWEIDPRDLTLLEKIGGGFFGDVLKAKIRIHFSQQLKLGNIIRQDADDKDSKLFVACKKLKGTYLQQDEADFLEEIRLMKEIGRHPHIVGMLACVTTSQPFCLIVEYCCHGDLLSYLQRKRPQHLNESESQESGSEDIIQESNGSSPEQESVSTTSRTLDSIRQNDTIMKEDKFKNGEKEDVWELTASHLLSFAWQIASGMEYLAGKHLVHRDLACRNVLVCENNFVKVSDFGLTRAVYEDGAYCQKTARRLPLRWMSIEAIIHRLFTEKSDVWSFGVVLWEIFTLGCFPYPCMTSRDILLRLRKGDRLDCPENCFEELRKLMSDCWHGEAEKRPTFKQLSERLGKMLEEESPNKYLNLDITYLYPFWEMKSTTEANESISTSSQCFDEVFEIDCATLKESTSDKIDVRYAMRRESTV